MEQIVVANNQFTGMFPGNFQPTNFIQALHFQNNDFNRMNESICDLHVMERGELTSMKIDCAICVCRLFCNPGNCTASV